MDNVFQWMPFYEEFADKLLAYQDKRDDLFKFIKMVASDQPKMEYFHFDNEEWWGPKARQYRIDPFSVIGILNRSTNDANRTVLAQVLAGAFDIKSPIPTRFDGIPILSSMNSIFGIDTNAVWELFILAIKAAEENSFSDGFKRAFEKAITVHGNGPAYISMGLFWIRPMVFMPLDAHSRAYISKQYGIPAPGKSGADYVDFLKTLKAKVDEKTPGMTFPEISYTAWAQKTNPPPGAPQAPTATEKQQRDAFKQWYEENTGTYNSANTITSAIGKAKLKNGRPVFAITTFGELDKEIKTNGLDGYFQSKDGDYSKMDVVFDLDPTVQRDDLKSGIKHYLNFLRSTGKDAIPGEPGKLKMDKNIILYGPPGTGKTYATIQYAVSIVENKPLADIK